MRRSMVTMLAAAAALSTPLAAQGPKLTLGLAYTVGSGWQVEALDVGYGRPVRAGPIAFLSLGARVGSFIDEGAIIGGAQGFVFGTTFAARTSMKEIAELGSDTSATRVGIDFTLEATGYAGTRSPLPVGSPWGAVSGLVGLRFGDPRGSSLGVLLGPTVFFGHVTDTRPFLGVRFDVPLARRERQP